eukprot:1158770-Pelagomonas_calceolata.AAC.4
MGASKSVMCMRACMHHTPPCKHSCGIAPAVRQGAWSLVPRCALDGCPCCLWVLPLGVAHVHPGLWYSRCNGNGKKRKGNGMGIIVYYRMGTASASRPVVLTMHCLRASSAGSILVATIYVNVKDRAYLPAFAVNRECILFARTPDPPTCVFSQAVSYFLDEAGLSFFPDVAANKDRVCGFTAHVPAAQPGSSWKQEQRHAAAEREANHAAATAAVAAAAAAPHPVAPLSHQLAGTAPAVPFSVGDDGKQGVQLINCSSCWAYTSGIKHAVHMLVLVHSTYLCVPPSLALAAHVVEQ